MRTRVLTGTQAVNLSGSRVLDPPMGYVGPLDGVTVSVCYGLRLLKSTYEGALVRLRRDSDDAESDFSADVNGDLDIAAIATWLGGAVPYVAKSYDQSGNVNDSAQATLDDQPLFVSSQNGRPALNPDGTHKKMGLTSAISGDRTAYVVMQNQDAVNGSIWLERAGDGFEYLASLAPTANYKSRCQGDGTNQGDYSSGVSDVAQAVLCGSWQGGGDTHSGINGHWGSSAISDTNCRWDELFDYTTEAHPADGYCWEIVILPDDERDSATEDAYLADVASYFSFSLDA